MAQQPVRGIELTVELEDFSGRTFRWDADATDPRNRPQSLYFRTQRGDGFADAGCSLYRPVDRDFPDLGLIYTMRIISLSGDVVYEGRVTGFPRQADPESSTITVNAAGWMSHGNDRTFRELYVDRDLSRWQAMSRARRLTILGASAAADDGQVASDATTGIPAAVLAIPGNASTTRQYCELLYDPGSGLYIGSVYYDFVRGTNTTASYEAYVYSSAVDTLTGSPTATSNLCASASSTGTLTASSGERFAVLQSLTPAGDGGTDGLVHDVTYRYLTVWGNHGLTKRGTAPSDGLYASDVIQNIVQRWCPKLQVGQIDATSYVIGQLAFLDPTKPYAAIQQINNFHQYELSVWEDRKFYWTQPTDMTDWDWEVRVGDPGVKLSLQGDSIEDVANGIVVTYTDLILGTQQVITPETNTSLSDTSATNPANLAGINKWIEITVPFATLAADAAQIGIAALAEFSRPKSPGTIEVGTQLRDRYGNWQPAYKVRCGERVILSGHPNDAPRRIIDTRWNDTPFQQGLSITVDNTSNRLDALLDRIQSGRSAAGI